MSGRFANLSPLKQAFLAIEELQQKLSQAERWRTEPVAIIGMGCRFPGAPDLESYWRLLENGVDAVREIPASRWDINAYFDANPDAPGRMSTRWGGFLDDLAPFDAEFFGISPREANNMDPQQRLLLEVSWEALEHAGQGPRDLVNCRTGVFVGITSDEYAQEFHRAGDPSMFNAYFASGIARSVAGGRISYALGIQGPNISIDTACSSSLVAVHTASLYLRTGECRMALAGGANVVLSPEISIAYSKSHMMAADGRCKAFDSRADGFVRGEGCGVVVLKRLSDALADGDRILALIRGSAVNQDGRSSGLTVPNLSAQKAVIRQALAGGGVKPEEIDHIEAHGTGTALGDPIEARALASVLGPGRTPDHPLVVGSVKTNLGHLESAAGIAGLIKTVLSMEHERIPRILHFREINPQIDWSGMPVEIPAVTRPWARGERRRLAGVSSFGFSGTNAHVIVEEAPVAEPAARAYDRPLNILTVSARSQAALASLIKLYAAELERPEADPGDVAFTANAGRAHFDYRLSVVAATAAAMREALLLAAGERVKDRDGVRPAFLFPGQGAQFSGMGKDLYDTHPEFRRSLEECAELLRPEFPEPLLEVLWGAHTDLLEQTRYTQPALFALEYALAQLWRSWGIEPSAVLGHSVGEYAAACFAGVYSLADGLKLIAGRARLMQAVRGRGAMTAAMTRESIVREALAGLESQARIAALNAPESIVISGYVEAIEQAEARLRQAGVRTQRLAVSHAFHSPQMAEMEQAFVELVKTIRFEAPRVPLISSVTGQPVSAVEMSDPEYWRRQVREPVRFAAAVETLTARGCTAFIEVGPGSTLSGLGRQTATSPEVLWAPSLRQSRGAWQQMLESLGKLWTRGALVDWSAFDRPYNRRKTALPTYPFERQRYWLEKPARKTHKETSGEHPLLGSRFELAADAQLAVWQSRISVDRLPMLADHGAFGSLIFPLTGYLEMMISATAGAGGCGLRDITVYEPLLLPPDGEIEVQLTLRGDALEIYSKGDGGWKRHATAQRATAAPSPQGDGAAALAARLETRDVGAQYRTIADRGMRLGPVFQTMEELYAAKTEAMAKIAGRESAAPFRFHPAVLDGCFQTVAAILPEDSRNLYLPVGIDALEWYRPAAGPIWAHTTLRADGPENLDLLRFDIRIFDDAGAVAHAAGLQMRRVAAGRFRTPGERDAVLIDIQWEPKPLPAAASADLAGDWLLVTGPDPVAPALAAEFARRGARCTTLEEPQHLRETVASKSWRGVVYLGALDADSRQPAEAQSSVCGGALQLVQALAAARAEMPPRLWLVTRGAQAVDGQDRALSLAQSTLWGLAQAIVDEHPEWRTVCVDLDPETTHGAAELTREIGGDDGEEQAAWRGGERFVSRLASRPPQRGLDRPLRLSVSARGVLDNLRTDAAERRQVPPGWVEIQVDAAGLNFRDVLNVLGMYPGDPGPLGSECAGHIVAVGEGVTSFLPGDDVITMLPGGQNGYALADARLLARRPLNLTAAQAATIPTAFLTARYTLETLAHIRPGDRVLIHAATGGVGLAAIAIARKHGAEIFATAGSERKREYLKSLGIRHVMNSRTLDFAAEILRDTGGRGVDIVLNSLTDDAIAASFSALAEQGRFLEIGKRNIWTHEQAAALGKNIAYHVIDLGETSVTEPEMLGTLLRDTAAAFEAGELHPLPSSVYSFADAAQAYRLMAQARHIGKVILEQPAARACISPRATYLVTGAFGAIGSRVVEWLAGQGARHIAVTGRNAPGPRAQAVLEQAARDGVSIQTFVADIADRDSVARVLETIASSMPPLRGVLHAAGTLDDGVLAQQTWDRFETVLAPKVRGAWNLHQLTQGLPLDFFVLFSSVATLVGAPGQGNYGAANAFLDALAHERRRLKLPATSINWGAWTEGMAAREDLEERRAALGIGSMAASQALDTLRCILLEAPAQTGAGLFDWPRFLRRYPKGAAPRRFAALGTSETAAAEGESALPARLAAAPEANRPAVLREWLHATAARVLGFPPARKIDPEEPLHALGLDSLMAVEFRNALAGAIGASLPATLLFSYPALADLAHYLAERLLGTGAAETAAKPATDTLDAVEELSDEEVDRMLAAKMGGAN